MKNRQQNHAEASAEREEENASPTNWGYELVCAKLAEGTRNNSSGADDLRLLFDLVSGHETCFLEFKATPGSP